MRQITSIVGACAQHFAGRDALRGAMLLGTALVALGGGAQQAVAQDAASQTEAKATASKAPAEIIVTARKRNETVLDVPVIENVVTGAALERTQTVDLKDLTKLSPGLMIGTAVLSIGQQVTLRGVGTSSFDPGIDQSVSLNIDGLGLGQGLAFSSGMFDVGQIEVLKGPQSLFYGKSSTGGVIALHTNDPTDQFEVKATAAYEGEAHTKRFEGVISGPVADWLKVRVAGMYTKTDGYYYNRAVVGASDTYSPAPGVTLPVSVLGGLTPKYDRTGAGKSYQMRGTVIIDPSPDFTAKLKVNYVHDKYENSENGQVKSCPDGVGGVPALGNSPFLNPNDNCMLDRVGYVVDANVANFPLMTPTDGVSFVASTQKYGTLELNYVPTDGLTLTSLTGYYNLHSHSLFNAHFAAYAGPFIEVSNPRFRRHDFTQELRATSDLPGWFNFTVGAFYQKSKVSDRVVVMGNTFYIRNPAGGPSPAAFFPLQDGTNQFSIVTWSGFGQARLTPIEKLEIDAGVRITKETRRETPYLATSLTTLGGVGPGTYGPNGLFYPAMPHPNLDSSTASPEFTISYKPTQDLNIFASYKIAYKSGSFSIATPPTLEANGYLDNSFGDEKVSGFEAGIKGRTLDNQLSFSLAGFRYIYKGLQVGGIEPTTGSLPVIRTVNAGSGKSYGAELEAHFSPRAVDGLTLNAAVNYLHARFSKLDNIPCYGGQTIAAGCNQQFAPALDQANPPAGAVLVNGVYGNYFAQDLSGAPFLRAPNWSGNFGFDWELPINSKLDLIFHNNNTFSSRFLAGPGLRSDFYQSAYFKVDAGITLKSSDDLWELALIGKNLTRKYTATNCSPSNFQAGLLGGEITGGNIAGPSGTDEMVCYMDPGRELWVRLTLRPFGR